MIRNTQYTADGNIDCEYKHPVHGWVPFTIDPADSGSDADVVSLWDAAVATEPAAYVAPNLADVLADWRGTAVLSRLDFCLALFVAGVLNAEEAETAASGGWPAAFDDALAGLTDSERAFARITWAGTTVVHRSADLLALVQAFQGMTDAALDTMFGWEA